MPSDLFLKIFNLGKMFVLKVENKSWVKLGKVSFFDDFLVFE